EELRGWVHLLNGEAAAAAEDGRRILAFVAAQTATEHNAWHRLMLGATGVLFTGDRPRAVAIALEAVDATPQQFDFVRLYSMQLAARIFAWAGAEDRALDLLETLSAEFPALGPAEIVRDPLFSKPLAANARYVALQARLESEIRRNRALFDEQRH
ncbi:MAG TPA: hypothetical protein VNK91_04065, partial [Burkholderiaceae bacterium]|nr:hypothetical protein [Burkholderiaceae bacterium]